MVRPQLDLIIEGISTPDWLPDYERFLLRALSAAGAIDWELSVTLTNDAFIHDLNKRWRGKDEPTDVLSFESDPEVIPGESRPSRTEACYGDLVISMDMILTNSAYFAVNASDELQRVSLHGILHLMGWDHATNEADEPMLRHQERLLAGIKERFF